MKSDSGATQMDRFKLKIPMLGDIWLKYQVAVFARMLVHAAVGRSVAGAIAGNRRVSPCRAA